MDHWAEQIGGGGLLVTAGVALSRGWDMLMRGRAVRKDLMAAAGEMAGDLMEGMRADLDALREEMRAMKAAHRQDMDEARRDRDDCERRYQSVAGDLRQARQEVASLIRQLRDPASTAPGGPLEGAVIQLFDGRAEVVSTAPERKPK